MSRKGQEAPAEITLPITPMLDMSFQLLFFFISTFKLPTGMEGSMDLNLPSEAKAKADKPENVDMSAPSEDKPPDLKSEITISVQTQAQGADVDGISNLTIEEEAGKTSIPPPYTRDLQQLTDKLAEIHKNADPKQSVKIQGDAGLKWRGVVKVMDACRKAGFENISFGQPPDYATYTHQTVMPDVNRPVHETPIRRRMFPVGVVVVALTLSASAVWVLAAPPVEVSDKSDPNFQPGAAAPGRLSSDEAAATGAKLLFANGFPTGNEVLGELALLDAGESLEDRLWTLFDPNVVRRIPPWMLGFVNDNTEMTKEIGDQEQDAYFTMLIFANRTSPAALDKAGRENEKNGADWVHVFRDPAKYRGEIVHFEGSLRKLRRFDPQPMAAQGGVKNYYEGFLFADLLGEDPVVFAVTELPKGLEPGDHLDVKVGLSGYFFKRLRYTAVDTKTTNKDRLAPYVIGHTLTLLTPPAVAEPPPDTGWVNWLGPAFFAVIGVTVAVLFAVGYWFRRGDWRVRGRLTAARHGEFVEPAPEQPAPPETGLRNRLSQGQSDYPTSEN